MNVCSHKQLSLKVPALGCSSGRRMWAEKAVLEVLVLKSSLLIFLHLPFAKRQHFSVLYLEGLKYLFKNDLCILFLFKLDLSNPE